MQDPVCALSVIMLDTGKVPRGKNGKKECISFVTSTAQFLLKMVVGVKEREWEEFTYASIQ